MSLAPSATESNPPVMFQTAAHTRTLYAIVFRWSPTLPFRSASSRSPYRSGRSAHWLKIKNPAAPAVKREAEEDWGGKRKASARRSAGGKDTLARGRWPRNLSNKESPKNKEPRSPQDQGSSPFAQKVRDRGYFLSRTLSSAGLVNTGLRATVNPTAEPLGNDCRRV
jgi:hypothetical protein